MARLQLLHLVVSVCLLSTTSALPASRWPLLARSFASTLTSRQAQPQQPLPNEESSAAKALLAQVKSTGKRRTAGRRAALAAQRAKRWARLPRSVEEIREANMYAGCVTIESPLAQPTLGTQVAPVGTPCIFRADAWDEARHCIDADSGRYGQFGWCWTKLDRSEWGSCSELCPLAGAPLTLGQRLDDLEKLVERLAEEKTVVYYEREADEDDGAEAEDSSDGYEAAETDDEVKTAPAATDHHAAEIGAAAIRTK